MQRIIQKYKPLLSGNSELGPGASDISKRFFININASWIRSSAQGAYKARKKKCVCKIYNLILALVVVENTGITVRNKKSA